MSCETPQCRKVRALVSELYRERNEPPCTVLDIVGSLDVQVNVQGEGNEVRSLTLVSLASDTLPSEVREVVSDFVRNPATRRYDCISRSYQ